MNFRLTDCTECGTPLEPVFDNFTRRYTDFPQLRDALLLEIKGGYGMFLDKPATAVILCHACAEKFFALHPWMKQWINQYSGNVYYNDQHK